MRFLVSMILAATLATWTAARQNCEQVDAATVRLEPTKSILIATVGCAFTHGAWQAAATSTTRAPTSAVQTRESNDTSRSATLAALRQKARVRIERERSILGESEFADIEARYVSAHQTLLPLLRPEGPAILRDLIQRYPRSNRAGCATLELARVSAGTVRERYLRSAITDYSDAWFESGVQVGAVARAMLAVYLAGLDRFAEAEAVALEVVTEYPGSVDDSGASLDGLLASIRLLRPAKAH